LEDLTNNLVNMIAFIQTPALVCLGLVIICCGYLFLFRQKEGARPWLISALIGFVLVKGGFELAKSINSIITFQR